MLSTRDAGDASIHEVIHDEAGREEGRGWAPLAVPPLTVLLLAAAALAPSPGDLAVATLSLLALALAAAAFAAARA